MLPQSIQSFSSRSNFQTPILPVISLFRTQASHYRPPFKSHTCPVLVLVGGLHPAPELRMGLCTTSKPAWPCTIPFELPPLPVLVILPLLSCLELLFLPRDPIAKLRILLVLILPGLVPKLPPSCRFSTKAAGKRPHFPFAFCPDQHH